MRCSHSRKECWLSGIPSRIQSRIIPNPECKKRLNGNSLVKTAAMSIRISRLSWNRTHSSKFIIRSDDVGREKRKNKIVSNDLCILFFNVRATNRNSGKRNGVFRFRLYTCGANEGLCAWIVFVSFVSHTPMRNGLISSNAACSRPAVVRYYTIHNSGDIEFSKPINGWHQPKKTTQQQWKTCYMVETDWQFV